MSSIFGGSQQQSTNQSTSQNQAYPALSAALSPQVSNGTTASGTLSGLLGGQGQAGSDAAFANFRNGTGYQFGLDQGSQAVTQNAAAKGLLNSGSTARALDTLTLSTRTSLISCRIKSILATKPLVLSALLVRKVSATVRAAVKPTRMLVGSLEHYCNGSA